MDTMQHIPGLVAGGEDLMEWVGDSPGLRDSSLSIRTGDGDSDTTGGGSPSITSSPPVPAPNSTSCSWADGWSGLEVGVAAGPEGLSLGKSSERNPGRNWSILFHVSDQSLRCRPSWGEGARPAPEGVWSGGLRPRAVLREGLPNTPCVDITSSRFFSDSGIASYWNKRGDRGELLDAKLHNKTPLQ